jgi:hypothetical protein
VVRPRVPPLRERDAVLRGDLDAALERDAVLPDLAPPVERFAAGLRFAEAVLEPPLDDLARLVFALEPVEVAREPLERVELERADEARPEDLLERPDELRDEPEPLLPELPLDASSLHLPLITRCAASATASAMIEPSLVALDTMLLAACDAVSAASRPASRILRRAEGLALIAAAAAARPAASISLLIAALASLSTVEAFELDELPEDFVEDDLDELLRADLAMSSSPSVGGKTLQARNGSRNRTAVPIADMLKGTAARCSDALRHGQRPKVWPFVSA